MTTRHEGSPTMTEAELRQAAVRLGDLLLAGDRHDDGDDVVVLPGARRTYGELREHALHIARALTSLGIGRGSRVGILMPNCLEFVDHLFGVTLAGAVVVPINARFAPRELGYVILNGDLDAVVTSDLIVDHVDFVARLHEALPGLLGRPAGAAPRLPEAPALKAIVIIGDRDAPGMMRGSAFDGLAAKGLDEATIVARHAMIDLDAPALMMYTSGTTAMPKGCVMSHTSLVLPAVVSGRVKFRLQRTDRFWDPLPMFHMSGILPLIAVMDRGAALLSMTHFSASEALELIDAERATVLYPSFPAVAQALLNHPDYHPDRWHQAHTIQNVAPPETLRAMQAQMPHTVQISSYGCTEIGGVVCFGDVEDSLQDRIMTSGTPLPGMEVEIRDILTGGVQPQGERGEIVVRGYGVFQGYYKDAARTAASLDLDGWFHTGDIGAMDADGRVSYLGRTKDMLKVGGENVAALEIESFLATHPAVSIAAVVGIPDPKYMEVPAAFVELRTGATLTEDELREHCARGLARFKVPQYIRFVKEWPMSATKIQKYRLQEELTAELARDPKTTES
jgi:fatty-acyl-CoA synthase